MTTSLEIHDMAGHLIRRLQQISASVFAERVGAAGFDVTPVQYAALVAIAANPGIDQATLAGLIAYDRVTIGGVLDRLEQKAMILRQTSSRDRRARILHMTSDGEAALAKLTPVVKSAQREILTGLDDNERETLLALLKKTTQAGNELSRAPLKTA
ncbi:MAG: MarR family transcriptional regulator [Nitratireductor sp.]